MSDAVIEAALAGFSESAPQMDTMGNTVVSLESSVSDAGEAATPDAGEVDSASSGLGQTDAPLAADDPASAPAAAPQDDIDKLLAAEGVQKDSIRGENRIPYSRTKKIIQNAQAKWKADYDKTVEAERQSWTQERSSLDNYKRQEEVASADPDRYISLLASVDPRYQKFLSLVGKTDSAAPAAPAVDDDPEPQPQRDEQGNPYYTPDGWKAWQSWTRRQAVKEAKAEFEKTYGSTLKTVQEREQAARVIEARRPVVQAQMSRIINTYGAELVSTHQDAIVRVLREAERAGQPMSADAAAAQVLMPFIRQDEATIRQKVLDEMNRRPAAVRGTSAPAQKRAVADDAPLTGDDLIRAELDRAFPNRSR